MNKFYMLLFFMGIVFIQMIHSGEQEDFVKAAYAGNTAKLTELHDSGKVVVDGFVNIELPGAKHTVNINALGAACVAEKKSSIDKLLLWGADVNATNENGFASLHWAAKFARDDVVDVLLSRGSKKELKTAAGRTAYDILKIAFEGTIMSDKEKATLASTKPSGVNDGVDLYNLSKKITSLETPLKQLAILLQV